MEPILQIQHVSIDFTQYTGRKGLKKQRLQVIRDLSLTICPGQVVAVVGASGSGKSLLAHGILHILPYNSHMEGEIFYDGAPLTETRAKQLRGQEIVLIPQGVTYLDPLMKVGPQIRKGGTMRPPGQPAERHWQGMDWRRRRRSSTPLNFPAVWLAVSSLPRPWWSIRAWSLRMSPRRGWT